MVIIGIPKVHRIKNGAAINATLEAPLTDATVQRDTLDFGPFNAGTILNISSVAILLKADGDTNRAYKVESGQMLSIDVEENFLYRYFTVENLDAAVNISADEIDATYVRVT